MKNQDKIIQVEIQRLVNIVLPSLPNFINLEGKSNDGFDIADFPDDELEKIGKAWTNALLEKAEKRRAEQPSLI